MIDRLPKIILFDWDGTLADSYAFLEGAHDYVLNSLDLEKRISGWFYEFFGMPADLIYRSVYGDKAEDARNLFLEYFHKHSAEATQPIPGAIEVILWLREQGIITGIVTNMRPEGIAMKLTHFGWSHYFDVVVGAGEAAQNKPAPDPIYLALERCGYDGDMEDVWFIGDTVPDMDAAQAAGVCKFFISPQVLSEHFVKTYDPVERIDNYRNFISFLQKL